MQTSLATFFLNYFQHTFVTYPSWAFQDAIIFPLLESNNLQWPEPSPVAIQDGEAEAPSVCILSDPQEHMAETREGKPDSTDSPLQRWSFWPRATSMNLQDRVNIQKLNRHETLKLQFINRCRKGFTHLREPFPVPTTSVSTNSIWCMKVYKLPSNALVNNPPDSMLEFSILVCSELIFEAEDKRLAISVESDDDSANKCISFPVRLFQTCMVPSQDATLPVDGRTQMSFTN